MKTALLAGVLAAAACSKEAALRQSTIEERMRESQARADFVQALTMAQYGNENSQALAAARAEFISACRTCAPSEVCEDEAARIEREPKHAINWDSPCR